MKCILYLLPLTQIEFGKTTFSRYHVTTLDKSLKLYSALDGIYISGTKVKLYNLLFLKKCKVKVVINLAPIHSATTRAKVPKNIQLVKVV